MNNTELRIVPIYIIAEVDMAFETVFAVCKWDDEKLLYVMQERYSTLDGAREGLKENVG